jgi:hypothetical protein
MSDPTTSLSGLFEAFTALKVAAQVYFETYRQAAGNADARLGRRVAENGVELSRFPTTADPFAGLTLEAVVQEFVRRRQVEAVAASLSTLEKLDAEALARVTK